MNFLKIAGISLFLMASMSSAMSSAHADTPMTDELTNQYFENCLNGLQKDSTMTPNSKKAYCVCTSVNMKKSMTSEDLIALSENKRPALNKVLLDVNGPCMQYPVRDMIQKKCMTDLKNDAMCSCLSQKVGEYTKQEVQKKLPKILADNPDVYDTMSPIVDSPEFQQATQQMALSCATNPTQK